MEVAGIPAYALIGVLAGALYIVWRCCTLSPATGSAAAEGAVSAADGTVAM